MNRKTYQYIFNNIGYSSYVDAHLSGLYLEKDIKKNRPFSICDWTESLMKEEMEFVWYNCKIENISLLYYNHIADIENNQYLKSRICATLIELNSSHFNLNVSCYQKHMRQYAVRLTHLIDSCIDQFTITDSPIWLFPVTPSFIKTAIIIQRVKLKYPDSHVIIYGADASMNNNLLLENRNIDAVICGNLYSEEALVNFFTKNSPKSNFWNKQWYWDEPRQRLIKNIPSTYTTGVLFDKLIPCLKQAEHSLYKKYYCNVTKVNQTLLHISIIADIHNNAMFYLSCRDCSLSFEQLLRGLLNLKEQYPDISIESIYYEGEVTNNMIELLSRLRIRKLSVNYSILEEDCHEEYNHTFAEILLNTKLLFRNGIELSLYRKYGTERSWNEPNVIKVKNCLHMLRLFQVSEFIDVCLESPISIGEEIKSWINLALYRVNGQVERLSQHNSLLKGDKFKNIITPIGEYHFAYQEYIGEGCIRSLELGKIDVLILKLLNEKILSFDDILIALNNKLNMAFLSIRVVKILEELDSQRLIYINDNFSQITSCIDFI